ncbi:glycosyltransferase [Teichococcus aestuarii]|uniref:Glycosyl transferase n=1 Tax=Teichococcus aestuarii TaxID=568898 RepID=A0A2U1V2P3_9PROT|nr:glycosyltransferase [Pseudoroseomonas aestuarii]PWC28166.1 glycosyl transferase [Pseudoroseomonas aestuarii]
MSVPSPWQRAAPCHDPLSAPQEPDAVLAIPVRNEVAKIGACLAALAAQTALARLTVLLLLNNCTDGTRDRVRRLRPALPFALLALRVSLPPEQAHAGEARGLALDAAAALLEARGASDGLLLTTDADSRVAPDWLEATRAAFAAGADAVAGAVRYDPAERRRLPAMLRRRMLLEERYHALLARLEARQDPCPHDPWPRHRGASGASLAVTLRAYRRAGGLPRWPVGEDRALAAALRASGARIRHATDVRVRTACRLQGRAVGGAADTLRQQALCPELPCDPMLEPAEGAARRFSLRAALRGAWERGALERIVEAPRWEARLDLPLGFLTSRAALPFVALWPMVEYASPLLRPEPLLPQALPGEIRTAALLLTGLSPAGAAGPADSVPPVPAALPA